MSTRFTELQTLFDKIISENKDDVTAIFITTTGDSAEPVLVQDTRKLSGNIYFTYAKQVARLSQMAEKMAVNQDSLLKRTFFQYEKGIVSVVRLGKQRGVYLFMVNNDEDATVAGIELLRDQYRERITELLQNAKAID
jgi:hypothetical protein